MSDANDNANVLTIARVRAIVREEIARALRERDQQKIRREEAEIDDLIAAPVGQIANHAEIDHAYAVARQENHITRMRVGMKITVHEHHL